MCSYLLARSQVAEVLSRDPENLERTLTPAGLRPDGPVAVEPRLHALGPELGDAALDRIPTDATALFRLVVQAPEARIELVVQTGDDTLNPVGELVNEDVFTLPGVALEVNPTFAIRG